MTATKCQRQQGRENDDDDIPLHGTINKEEARQYSLNLDNIITKLGTDVQDKNTGHGERSDPELQAGNSQHGTRDGHSRPRHSVEGYQGQGQPFYLAPLQKRKDGC